MPTVILGDNTGQVSGTISGRMVEPFAGVALTDVILASNASGPDQQRGFVSFSGLSSISGPVTVSAVTLDLWLESGDPGTQTVSIYLLQRNLTQGDVSWTNYSNAGPSAWTAGGAGGSGDAVAVASNSQSIPFTTGQYYSWTSAQMATDAQTLINAAAGQIGYLVRIATSGGAEGKAFTVQGGADGQRPRISITYTAGGAPGVSGPPVIYRRAATFVDEGLILI